MNLPAADAFSLSPHSHSSRHRRRVPSISMPGTRRSSTRSPSPQVVFPSPSPLAENQKNAAKGLRHVPANTLLLGRVSSQATNGHARLQDVAEDGINNILEGSLDTNKHGENGDIIRDKETRKIDWEIPRKLLHSSIGFIVIPLYTFGVSPRKIVTVLSTAGTIISSVEYVRLRWPRFGAVYQKYLGFLMRESEKEKTNGVIWYMLGCIIVLLAYPPDIAVVSILILSWCDTAASVFGRMYGPRTRPLPRSLPIPFTKTSIPLFFAQRKSLAGLLAGCTTGAFIAAGFWGFLRGTRVAPPSSTDIDYINVPNVPVSSKLAMMSLITGLVAGVAEATDVGSLDDNLTLPIMAGGIIWAIFKLVGYYS